MKSYRAHMLRSLSYCQATLTAVRLKASCGAPGKIDMDTRNEAPLMLQTYSANDEQFLCQPKIT